MYVIIYCSSERILVTCIDLSLDPTEVGLISETVYFLSLIDGGTVLPSEWDKAVDKAIADAATIVDYYNKKCHQYGVIVNKKLT